MFTGIIEAVGRVREARDLEGARTIAVEVAFGSPPAVGDSVAVSGVCLTVERVYAGGFEATAVPETLARTTLSSLVTGDTVNVERAASATRLLGGHIVQGHVDGVGEVVAVERAGGSEAGRWLDVVVPADVHDLCVEKGSIAIDGVSLTIARRHQRSRVTIALVPHTLSATIAQGYAPGRRVNVEADIVARYVREHLRRLVVPAGPGENLEGERIP